MTWESFYLICFGVGLILSIVSFAGGFMHVGLPHLHMGHTSFGHTSLGHTGLGHGHAPSTAARAASISSFNAFTLTCFLCWFGGAGYLLSSFSGLVAFIVLLLAVASGLAGAALVFGFLVKVLLPRERILTAQETEMTGVIGRVSSGIRAGGTGEILFSQGGARRSAAARSEDGAPVSSGAEVVVLRYEAGVAYVQIWDELAAGLDPAHYVTVTNLKAQTRE